MFDNPTVATDASGVSTRLVYGTQMKPAAVVHTGGHLRDVTRGLAGIVVAGIGCKGLHTDFDSKQAER